MDHYESPSFSHIKYLVVTISEHTHNKYQWTLPSLEEARFFAENVGGHVKIYKLEEIE